MQQRLMATNPMADATSPGGAGPRRQRVALVLLGIYGSYLALSTPAGRASVRSSASVLAVAVTFALAARGNRRHKLVVLIGLAMLLALGVASLAWA
jgi:hypothetical protein